MKSKTKVNSDVVDGDNIEVITWRDAQSDDGWDSERTAELATIITVGFLIKENKEAVCVASTWADPDSNCRLHIPKSWIKDRKTMCINKKKRPYKTRVKSSKASKPVVEKPYEDLSFDDQYNEYYGGT